MSLYRIDFLTDEGIEPMTESYFGDYLSRRRSVAIEDARKAYSPWPARITRIYGAGSMKVTAVVHPDGRVTRS